MGFVPAIYKLWIIFNTCQNHNNHLILHCSPSTLSLISRDVKETKQHPGAIDFLLQHTSTGWIFTNTVAVSLVIALFCCILTMNILHNMSWHSLYTNSFYTHTYRRTCNHGAWEAHTFHYRHRGCPDSRGYLQPISLLCWQTWNMSEIQYVCQYSVFFLSSTNPIMILLTSIVCLFKTQCTVANYSAPKSSIVFLLKTHKWAPLGPIFLHYNEYGCCSLLTVNPTHTILLL